MGSELLHHPDPEGARPTVNPCSPVPQGEAGSTVTLTVQSPAGPKGQLQPPRDIELVR